MSIANVLQFLGGQAAGRILTSYASVCRGDYCAVISLSLFSQDRLYFYICCAQAVVHLTHILDLWSS